MKERGIIMSAPMVRALLDGSKTQTRRVLARNIIHKVPNPPIGAQYYVKEAETFINRNPNAGVERKGGMFAFYRKPKGFYGVHFSCPYGVAGDRLWVRETHWRFGKWVRNGKTKTGRQRWCFKVTNQAAVRYEELNPYKKPKSRTKEGWYKRPSIFMSKKYARITLEITRVRVERLQDISEEDVKAEGVTLDILETEFNPTWNYVREYVCLWDSLHGKGAWEKNPWIWVLEFKRA